MSSEDKVVAKSWLLKSHFVGLPKEDDFELVEKVLPPLAEGEFLCETKYASVDPYMRAHLYELKTGSVMIGGVAAKVIQSRNEKYPIGTAVFAHCGWSTHFIPSKTQMEMIRILPTDLHPLSYALGIFGIPGLAAYFGLLDICDPKAGETVFVNAAAGATGSVVGQIAKIKGCHTVGCAGSDEKVDYLKQIGFDGAFNYKTVNLEAKLKELCPKGIDCFFDNVGGSMFDTVLSHMNRFGRVTLCGSISSYNNKDNVVPKGSYVHLKAIFKELKLQGFIVTTHAKRFDEACNVLRGWINEGKLKCSEHIIEGFEKMPEAFISLFHGANIGKIVLKVAE